MSQLEHRFGILLNERNISPNAYAKLIDVNNKQVYDWANGITEMRTCSLAKAVSILGINEKELYWLVMGNDKPETRAEDLTRFQICVKEVLKNVIRELSTLNNIIGVQERREESIEIQHVGYDDEQTGRTK